MLGLEDDISAYEYLVGLGYNNTITENLWNMYQEQRKTWVAKKRWMAVQLRNSSSFPRISLPCSQGLERSHLLDRDRRP